MLSIWLSLVFLLGSSILVALKTALQSLGAVASQEEFQHYPKFYSPYTTVQKIFRKEKWSSLFQFLSFSTQITRMCYGVSVTLYLFAKIHYAVSFGRFLPILALILFITLIFDFFFRLLGKLLPLPTLKLLTIFGVPFFSIFSPISLLLMSVQRQFVKKLEGETAEPVSYKIKHKLLELLQESEIKQLLDPVDQKLLFSIASFRDRVAREIMVPRIDLYALSTDQTIHEVAQECIDEGYSRIPVYKDRIDNIVGVLLYKDVLSLYLKAIQEKTDAPMHTPIESLMKPVLFAPESKRISTLLQEFRSEQSHMAIIVDEYGGTEGIVTIEDILEELVGEIADEYDDQDEEKLYEADPEGGWIVDAKMNTLDIEKELGIQIPDSPEYDTIGGYVFHRAGSIPSIGWCIHHDDFALEILSSDERSIEKIRISPRT